MVFQLASSYVNEGLCNKFIVNLNKWMSCFEKTLKIFIDKEGLGWESKIQLDHGLEKTISHFMEIL